MTGTSEMSDTNTSEAMDLAPLHTIEKTAKPGFNTTQVEFEGVQYTALKEGQAEVLFSSANGVFYNPVQEFNRDLSICIIREFSSLYNKKPTNDKKEKRRQAYLQRLRDQELSKELVNASSTAPTDNTSQLPVEPLTHTEPDKNSNESLPENSAVKNSPTDSTHTETKSDGGLRILEALAASGLRSVRYAKEIPGIRQIITNDLSKQAVNCIRRNVAYNGLEDLITPTLGDASTQMYMNREGCSGGERFDVVDLDPYGSPSLFLDGAVQSVTEGGLLLVTCTDMAVLCGNSPDTCYSKYGATSLKTKSCHEVALRIVLQSIESHANRYGRYIEPLVSVSVDFYCRIAVRVYTSQQRVKQSYTKVGHVYHCVGCQTITPQAVGHIEVSGRSIRHRLPHGPPVADTCKHCHGRHQVAGPLWLGPIHDTSFLQLVLDRLEDEEAKGITLGTQRRLVGMLTVMQEELPDVLLYHVHDKLCSIVGSMSGKLQRFMSALLNAGYRVSQSHCHKNSVKTDAPASVVWDVVRAHEQTMPAHRMRKSVGEPGYVILNTPQGIEVDFAPNTKANLESRERGLRRFQINPEPFWGPSTRASTKVLGQSQQEKKTRNQSRKLFGKRHLEYQENRAECERSGGSNDNESADDDKKCVLDNENCDVTAEETQEGECNKKPKIET